MYSRPHEYRKCFLATTARIHRHVSNQVVVRSCTCSRETQHNEIIRALERITSRITGIYCNRAVYEQVSDYASFHHTTVLDGTECAVCYNICRNRKATSTNAQECEQVALCVRGATRSPIGHKRFHRGPAFLQSPVRQRQPHPRESPIKLFSYATGHKGFSPPHIPRGDREPPPDTRDATLHERRP